MHYFTFYTNSAAALYNSYDSMHIIISTASHNVVMLGRPDMTPSGTPVRSFLARLLREYEQCERISNSKCYAVSAHRYVREVKLENDF